MINYGSIFMINNGPTIDLKIFLTLYDIKVKHAYMQNGS